jgi:hypothetical protein
VEVLFDVELVLFELAVDGLAEVDPAQLDGLVEGAPQVSEREVEVMRDADMGLQRAELDARFVAITTRKNDVAPNDESGLYL